MQWQFSSRSWFKRNSIWLIIRGLQISQRLQIFTPPWSNRMLHEVHTQRNRLKFHPSQKQCSCVHNPRFKTVRKRFTKQKKVCQHNHTYTCNSRWNRNPFLNGYAPGEITIRLPQNRNEPNLSDGPPLGRWTKINQFVSLSEGKLPPQSHHPQLPRKLKSISPCMPTKLYYIYNIDAIQPGKHTRRDSLSYLKISSS